MLGKQYFDGSRLAAYADILKEFGMASFSVPVVQEVPMVVLVSVGKEVALPMIEEFFSSILYCQELNCVDMISAQDVDVELVNDSYSTDRCGTVPEGQMAWIKEFDLDTRVNIHCDVTKTAFKYTTRVIKIYFRGMRKKFFDISKCNYTSSPRIRSYFKKAFPYYVEGFSGTEFRGLRRRELTYLKSNPYYVSPKRDGERFFLIIYGRRMYLSGRDDKILYLRKLVDVECCVLDGELIGELYVAFDVVACDQFRQIKARDFQVRLAQLQRLVSMIGPATGGRVICQQFYHVDQIDVARSLSYEGLIFTPMLSPYVTGYSDKIFKFKEGYDTVDFLVRPLHNGKIRLIYFQYVGVKPIERIAYEGFHIVFDKYPNLIVEAKLINGTWEFVRARLDKLVPNSHITYQDVFHEAKDPLTYDELKFVSTDN